MRSPRVRTTELERALCTLVAAAALYAAGCAEGAPAAGGSLRPLPGGAVPAEAAAPEPPRAPEPPPEPGASRVRFEGCLAQAPSDDAGGARAARRTPPMPERVDLRAVPGGLSLVHDLDHNCCLAAEVTSRVEGWGVVVRETFAGTPCRCRCRSTIRASVGLAPGRYRVEVVAAEPGDERSVHTGEIVVPPVSPPGT
jgi:hypothetical protein